MMSLHIPPAVDDLVSRGEAAFAEGDLVSAEQCFRQALDLDGMGTTGAQESIDFLDHGSSSPKARRNAVKKLDSRAGRNSWKGKFGSPRNGRRTQPI